MDKQEEIWRPVKGYEGLYEVSNRGRIRSVDRWVTDEDGIKRFRKGKILKPGPDKKGYLHVGLGRNGKKRFFLVHRLVAMAWLDNSEGKPQINHIDEDKSNNDVSNLEWTTAKENTNWGTGCKRSAASRSKAVQALDPETGQVVMKYSSTMEAERNGFNSSNISACCLGKCRTHKGFAWRYKQAFDYSRMLAIYDIALEQYRKKTKTA